MSIVIHWFRQDLRLEDNTALFAATQNGRVLPIYILDNEYDMGEASRVWLHHSLVELNASLCGTLRLFTGKTINTIRKIIAENHIRAIYWNRCYEPQRIVCDKAIKAELIKKGTEVYDYNSSLLQEPWTILKQDNLPYKVFTPFYKKAYSENFTPRKPIPSPPKLRLVKNIRDQSIDHLKLLPSLSWGKRIMSNWRTGEKEAKKKLAWFSQYKLRDYEKDRNFPGQDKVSHLSPHLHFGEISPQQIWYSVKLYGKGKNVKAFLREICWREFSYYLLYHFPDLPKRNLQKKFTHLPWKDNIDTLKAWQKARTGYPIVDAGMRQLWQTGYIHNRVRMIVASFLVKNLLLHWRYGEEWFWNCLLDADLASNSASWQWIAGCGTDALPYFRIFNPITQGRKFDSSGTYTRCYVPELKNIPNEYLFNPWEAPEQVLVKAGIVLGQTYPFPIVDFKTSRAVALSAYQSIKE